MGLEKYCELVDRSFKKNWPTNLSGFERTTMKEQTIKYDDNLGEILFSLKLSLSPKVFARGENFSDKHYKWVDGYVEILSQRANWHGSICAIVRNAPDNRGVRVSVLTNEDVITVLHASTLGIDQAAAIELAFKNLLTTFDLNESGRVVGDASGFTPLALVSPCDDEGPQIVLAVSKDLKSFVPEWTADECVLLCGGGNGFTLPVPQEVVADNMRSNGFRYEMIDEIAWEIPRPLPASASEWAALRREVQNQVFDLEERFDPQIRAAAYAQDGSETLFPYDATVAVAALIRMGFRADWAASVVGDGKALAIEDRKFDARRKHLAATSGFSNIDSIMMGTAEWRILIRDVKHYEARSGYDAWAIAEDGSPYDIEKLDPTRHLVAKARYHCWSHADQGQMAKAAA